MFYSHTFLARKGPLGMVWCAAHLSKSLKKSHYASTDIASTVDRIMFPEVSIALRMSSHLLLGVVRIYSMKLEDLWKDATALRDRVIKSSILVAVDLPADATDAPFHSVTLPDSFELDAMNLDYDFYNDRNQDKYLRSLDDITLSCDQIPTGKDPYITINFDKDVLRCSSSLDNDSGLRTEPLEEEVYSARPAAMDHGVCSRNPSRVRSDDNLFERIPEIEALRENVPVWTDPHNDVIPPDKYIEQQINNGKEPATWVAEKTTFDREVRISPLHSPVPIHSPVSDHADVMFSNNSLGHEALNLALNPSPLVDKPRKRKQRYDEATVLTNIVMKASLENCNDIQRKRKFRSSSGLNVWRSKNKTRKEQIFSEPLIIGFANNLRNIYGDNYISSKPHLKKIHEEPSFAQSSPLHMPSFEPTTDYLEEIEILRNYHGPVDNYIIPEGIDYSSSRERGDFTPGAVSSIGLTQKCTTWGTTSTETAGSNMGTLFTDMEYHPGSENPCLSSIPQDMGSAEIDDLNFLASEDYTPSSFRRAKGVSSLSGTTRNVAEYLIEKHNPISEELEGVLSLNELLEGKTRKVCARMLFETLVLKCDELVDVQQEEAYGDIKLKLTPKLFNYQN